MPRNLFLFTGEETYLLQEQISLWKKAFLEKHGDLNLEDLDAAQVPLNELRASLEAMPFLGDKRLIFVHDLPERPKTKNADKVSKKDEKREEELKKLVEGLDQIPDSTIVVFVQSEPDKRKTFYKSLLKQAQIKEFKPLLGSALTSWIQQRVGIKGGVMTPLLAERLVALVGQNLWRLANEIDKLCTYPQQPITAEVIEALVVPTLEANIFQLTDAIAQKRSALALKGLQNFLASGEKLQPLFYMIARQFRLLLQAQAFLIQKPTGEASEFATLLKLHPFVAKNTLSQARSFSLPELKQAYQGLLKIDEGLKTSQIRVLADDQQELALALEQFILSACMPATKKASL